MRSGPARSPNRRRGKSPAPPEHPPAAAGFDVAPAPPRRLSWPGLSATQRAYLALGVIAILGSAAVVVDILAARDGNPPTRGIEHLVEEGALSPGDPPGAEGGGDGQDPAGLPADAGNESTGEASPSSSGRLPAAPDGEAPGPVQPSGSSGPSSSSPPDGAPAPEGTGSTDSSGTLFPFPWPPRLPFPFLF